MAENKLDITMEQWDLGDYGVSRDVIERVTLLGSNGITARLGWYIPDYMARDHPEVIEDPRLLNDVFDGQFEVLNANHNWSITINSITLIQNYSLNAVPTIY